VSPVVWQMVNVPSFKRPAAAAELAEQEAKSQAANAIAAKPLASCRNFFADFIRFPLLQQPLAGCFQHNISCFSMS
jgi:hypothetical protein